MGHRSWVRAAVGVMTVAFSVAAPGQIGPRDVDEEALFATAATRPATCRIVEIGKTGEGRPLRSVLLGRDGPTPAEERPRLVVVAGMDADQAGSMLIAARLPALLLDLSEDDEALRALLVSHAVEVIPAAALDALAALRTAPLGHHRRNARPVDDDRDALVDEDGPEDLDGDGVIAEMRVPDPLGPWRVSDEDPRLMTRADPKKGERGLWRIETEGIDDDGDGALNEDPPGGTAFDRNFPHGWREFDKASGPHGISEPETRALIDRILATPSVVGVLVLGRRDNLVEAPAGTGDGKFFPAIETEDRPWFEEIVKRRKERLGFERKLDDGADGALHQWAYAQFGVFGLASKAYEFPKPEQATSLPSGKKAESDEAKRLLDSDRRLGGKGFVDWKPFKHPTLGDVEIGGFVPGASDSPTAEELPALAEKHARFCLDVLALFPKIELVEATAKPLGGGLHEVTAVVRNVGRTPTLLRVASRTRVALPSRAELGLAREAFELGEPMTRLETFGPSGDGRKLRWIVRAKAGDRAALKIWTEKAGRAEAEIVFAEEAR